MLLSLVMLLLLIAVFLSCGALIGFAESIIAPQGEARGDDGIDMALHILAVLLALVVIYLFYAVIHPERF